MWPWVLPHIRNAELLPSSRQVIAFYSVIVLENGGSHSFANECVESLRIHIATFEVDSVEFIGRKRDGDLEFVFRPRRILVHSGHLHECAGDVEELLFLSLSRSSYSGSGCYFMEFWHNHGHSPYGDYCPIARRQAKRAGLMAGRIWSKKKRSTIAHIARSSNGMETIQATFART